jgi:hypothetical protein
MKYLLFIPFLALLFQSLIAQESINTSSIENIKIYLEYGDLKVYEVAGNDVIIKKSIVINDETDTKHYSLTTSQEGKTLKIDGELDEENVKQYKVVHYNDGRRVYLNKDDANDKKDWDGMTSYGFNLDINIEIGIPKNKKVSIKMLYGNTLVQNITHLTDIDATYGSVDVLCNSITINDMNVKSTYNHVDLSLPDAINADVKLKTEYGSLYTNFDFKPSYKKEFTDTPHGDNISSQLNKGGTKITVESTYDNVYLRKI